MEPFLPRVSDLLLQSGSTTACSARRSFVMKAVCHQSDPVLSHLITAARCCRLVVCCLEASECEASQVCMAVNLLRSGWGQDQALPS